MKNNIFIKTKNKVLLTPTFDKDNVEKEYIATFLINIENLGFTFSKPVIDVLSRMTDNKVMAFYKEIIPILKKMVGANVKHKPMYPNFPKQVMEASWAELYINAIFHYLTSGTWSPEYIKDERFPITEKTKLTVIDLGTEEEFTNICKNLLSSKTSISEEHKEYIEWYIEEYKNNLSLVAPKEIPLKENIALYVGTLETLGLASFENIKNYFKTATDVLRFAVMLSGGDISLAEPCIFDKFKRPVRRLILDLLNNCNCIEEDMLRYKERWVRLGEILHPGEYKGVKVYQAFHKLRNGIKIETFYGKLDKYFKEKKYIEYLKLLKSRPGEFARRIDFMLREGLNSELVVTYFETIADKISTPVLLQLLAHFKHRNEKKDMRIFFPKGNVAKAVGIDNILPKLKQTDCNCIVRICEDTLKKEFAKRDTLKDVKKAYIDKDLENYIVPFSQRSASEGLRTLTRGSKLAIDDKAKVIRAFIHWKNISEYDRVDVDLSVSIYNKDWGLKGHISYTNLRSNAYGSCHSGDITNAPRGASEFVDLNIEKLRDKNIKYVVLSVHSFTGQVFTDIPECFFGFMTRENALSGKIYEPKTVKHKIDLASESRTTIPAIIDIEDLKAIWCDMSLNVARDTYCWGNNIENNRVGLKAIGKSMVDNKKLNLYELFNLWISSKNIEIVDREDAEITFALDGDITPFDIDKISGEFI